MALLLLFLAGCASDEIQVSFTPENPFARDNALSLQAEPGNEGATFQVRVRVGREAPLAADADPVDDYQLDQMVRVRFTLLFQPEVLEFSRFIPGTFFEDASGGQNVFYSVEAEVQGGQQTGRIFVEAAIDQILEAQEQGDLMLLEFVGVQEGVSTLVFENFFGDIFDALGQPLTGISFYGGRVVVLETSS